MKSSRFEQIRQKAEKLEIKRSESTKLENHEDQDRLTRILKKAEALEKEKQQSREWSDNIQAIQETYGLSDEEIRAIIHEVEQDDQESQIPAQSDVRELQPLEKLKKLFFSSRGRIGRSTFWISIFATVVFQGFFSSLASRGLAPLGVLALAGFYSQLMLVIKRFHDLDKSGLHTFLTLIPIVNVFVFIFLFFFPGTEGPNRFEDD
ncbi:MAG: DUF805 domain-containing protein [SAR324 cluster bacterium]|nr:DUF805 domain-containing protein [SAR324 cluster bacterium]